MINKRNILVICLLIFAAMEIFAQVSEISGNVCDHENIPLPGVTVALKGTSIQCISDHAGNFKLPSVPVGEYTLVVFSFQKEVIEEPVKLSKAPIIRNFKLTDIQSTLDEVIVSSEDNSLALTRLNGIENFGIHEGKKTEVVLLKHLTVNTATNNARQIYSRITGLNIWESDAVGLQLGIGGRGLSPNRTVNFNTRQNGYDISADALGYPESYYTPPVEALERIEIIRGAASLQYGTQFGGMLNFRFKEAPADKKVEVVSRMSGGSWGFFGTFNSLSGALAKDKIRYFSYFNYKTGEGYRDNSDFSLRNGYGSIFYDANENLTLNVELTKMNYLTKQAGGLTDAGFKKDPVQSLRSRNWFKVDWNLLAVNATYKFSPQTQLNIRNFGLIAERASLGNLDKITVIDMGQERTLIDGTFNNVGNETRLLHRYHLYNKQHAFLTGVRLYKGRSTARQGNGDNGSSPDFRFKNPEDLENSNYIFPNINYAAFIENVFDLSDKVSLTPGIRAEYIRTEADGYYKKYVKNSAGTLVVNQVINENESRSRSFLIAGLGINYKPTALVEFYGNISQNYRAINFTDLRVVNPNFVIDPEIHDEKGFTMDLGVRSRENSRFNYEVTAFYIAYHDKIGQILLTDTILYNDYRFRGNISDARNVGVEAFGELDLSSLFAPTAKSLWSVFINTSFIDARYLNSRDKSIEGNLVEMVPPVMVKLGTDFGYRGFSSSVQYVYTAQHFSDASNAEKTATAVEGIIPAYSVIDLTASYAWKWLTLEASCNNLLNAKYFTRRAESYPGPGIIPSDGRGFYVTVQAKVGK